MSDYRVEFRKNEIISFEREHEPGKFYRCLVDFVDTHGRPQLLVQDKYEVGLSNKHLKEYMYDNCITQGMLAALLHVSRTTICRYLAGTRKIPTEHFRLLGIELIGSELQTQSYMEKVSDVVVAIRALNKKVDRLVPPKEKE